ncbi:MAG TPA: hypothetical protein VEC35_01280 [Noviherbaspirillum sp.]|nr:hypothetical protein [Noviherbaspirillum sp.]
MAVQLGHQLGAQLVKALGLPNQCVWFELRCAAGEPISIRCEYYPDKQDGQEFESILTKYEVVERTVAHGSEPVDFDAWMEGRKKLAHEAMLSRYRAMWRIDVNLRMHAAVSEVSKKVVSAFASGGFFGGNGVIASGPVLGNRLGEAAERG